MTVKLTKNADPDKHRYSGYCIRSDSRSLFSIQSFNCVKNVIIFGVDKTIVHHCILITEKRDILVLGEVPTQGLDDAIKTAEAKYSIDFTRSKNVFLSLHFKGSNRFLFLNIIKIYQFKARDFEIKPYSLCLGNISKDFTVNNLKKTVEWTHVWFFS